MTTRTSAGDGSLGITESGLGSAVTGLAVAECRSDATAGVRASGGRA